MATFEGYERREAKILGVLKEYGITKLGLWNEEFIDTYEEDVNSTRRMPNSLGRSNLISTWILTRAGMKMSAQAAFLR